MELRRYLAIAWRWAWLLALGAIVGGTVAFAVSRAQTPMYRATATVLINQSQAVTGPTYNDVLANQQLTQTYGRLVTSGPVLEQVAQKFELSYAELREMISISTSDESQLIDITVQNADPDLASRIANETARVFAEQIRESQLGQLTTVEADIQRQLTDTQTAIDERQQQVTRLSTPQAGIEETQRLRQLAEVQSQIDSLRQNQVSLQRQLQDLRISLARSINNVTLADPARVPEQPFSPRTLLNSILGTIVGLMLVAGIVALAEYLDDTVKSAADVDRLVGASTLGTVPRFRRQGRPSRGGQETASRLLSGMGHDSPVAEAYRMVRTNLEFARSGHPGRTLLVTSALPNEGKTTTAANLSLMLAESGLRVILVDADLRKRSLHRLFDAPSSTGLSTLFVMESPVVTGFLRPTEHENLLLLPAGPPPPNPAELLASSRMREIIALLAAEADLVIFDSPPLLSIADTAGLAPAVDGVVLVVDSGRTRGNVLVQAVEVLRRANATLWGVVLNKLQGNHGGGYSYYGRYHGDGDDRPPSQTPTAGPRGYGPPGRRALSGEPRPVMQARIQDPDRR